MATYNNYREHVYYLYYKYVYYLQEPCTACILIRNMYNNYKGRVK